MSILSEVAKKIKAKLDELKAYSDQQDLFIKELVDQNAESIDSKLSPQDSKDVEITDSTKGIILNSPSGKRFRITVNDDGNLVKQEVDGDNNGIGDMTIGDNFTIQ
jgi:hypothetical protein